MSSISTYGQFLRTQTQNLAIQERLNDYGQQTATGKKTTVYGGLGAEARQSISLRGEVTELETYQTNIDTMKLRISGSVESMERIKDIAADVRDQLTKLSGNPPPDQKVVNDIARRGYDEVAAVLNTKVDGRYIFAGSDIDNPPFPNASQFFTDIQTEVGAYAANGAALTVTNTTGIATEANGATYFSTTLQTADTSPLRARVDRNLDLSYQVRANGPGTPDIPGTQDPVTGEIPPFREILRSLATAATLTYDKSNPASFDDFATMLSTTRTNLDTAAKTMDSHIGILGNTYNRIEELDIQHEETGIAIKTNLSAVEDVDMADAISKLQLVQTQLQASYKVTTTLRSINLIDFL